MGRPIKKPNYNRDEVTQQYLSKVTEAFGEPFDNRFFEGRHKPSLREVATQFHSTPISIRRALITAGVYSTGESRRIHQMLEAGVSIEEIGKQMHLAPSSVKAYIPYTKIIYKLPEKSVGADRVEKHRKRKQALLDFKQKWEECLGSRLSPDIYCSITDDVWHIIMMYEGYPFQTYKGDKFRYRIKGNEIFVNRKEASKSITRSSVDIAVKEALGLSAQGVKDYGPKKLKVFGASYIWGIFHVIGLC